MSIKRNLHVIDRIARALIGVVCIYIGFIDHTFITNQIVSVLVGVFGIVNVGAAVVSHCPVYGIAGFSTYSEDDKGPGA